MKTFQIFALIFLFYSFAASQDQIDSLVSLNKDIDSTKKHLLYDYRLPDWGYQRLYLDFYGSISGKETLKDKDLRDRTGLSINFRPSYFSYSESEEEIFSISSSLSSYYNYSKGEDDDFYSSRDYNSSVLNLNYNLNLDIRRYLKSNSFLKFSTQNYFRYYERENESNQINSGNQYKSKSLDIIREYQPSIQFGTGYGRVRNITPVFRALRFNERLKNITHIDDLTSNDLAELAELFSKKSIYNRIYDRPEKYFYSQLPKSVLSKLSEMQPWEIMYLGEAFNEITGDRFEGFDVNGGLLINYEKRDYSNGVDTELFLLGLYFEQEYYHNINTSYQIGTNFFGSVSKTINENTPYDYFGKGGLQIFNLWNLTDRVLLKLDIGLESGFASSESWERVDEYFADVNFIYFIENNLSLNTQISYNFTESTSDDVSIYYNGSYYNPYYEEDKSWGIQLNLRYYLTRNFL
ncbi:MAG: hypothetical protein D8M58_13665 [Calditrichaeota bacterium]|nr:MAG: hypothetical protein DWQ03_14905 [Calditrichota bacterium]MBL1206447.1 hypothetical protein [Calditrichota bacterium]NOG46274.1 hypothetical protein [Calditrichota bacterium]